MTSDDNGVFNICIDENIKTNVTPDGKVLWSNDPSFMFAQLLGQSMRDGYQIYKSTERERSLEQRHDCQIIFGGYIADENLVENSSYVYGVESVSFATRVSDYQSNDWAFVNCFSLSVWICLTLAVALVSGMFFWTSRKKVHYKDSAFYNVASLFGQVKDWKPKTSSHWVIVIFWLVAISFILFCYTSVLLSFLTVRTRTKGPQTIDDVNQGIKEGRIRAFEAYNKRITSVFEVSPDEKLQQMGKEMQTHKRFNPSNDDLKKNDVVIANQRLLGVLYKHNNYYMPEDPVLSWWYRGILWSNKESLEALNEKVNRITLRIWSSGLLQHKMDMLDFRVWLHVGQNKKELEESPVKPLSLQDLSGVFYCLIAGHLLATVVLILEMLAERRNVRYIKRRREVKRSS